MTAGGCTSSHSVPLCLEALRLFCREHFSSHLWGGGGGSSRQSAVLILLYPDGDRLRIVMLARPNTLRRHPGQVAFPGGAREAADLTPVATALREASEEIGLDPKSVDVIGLLPREFAYTSDFFIVPVVAFYPHPGGPSFRADPIEVEEILAPALDELHLFPELKWHGGETLQVLYPVFPVERHRLWGASARITLKLLRLLDSLGRGLTWPS